MPPPPCIDPPKTTIVVRVTRPGGHIDTVQADFDSGATTTTLPLPGAAGPVASFDTFVTAISGAVLDKTDTKSGNF